MSFGSHISLIDLTRQFPFQIDNELKNKLCFAETLVVSCGHYDGDVGDESSESEWSCYESTESKVSEEAKEELPIEIKDFVEEAEPEQDELEDDNFHFYFFPDCTKPAPPKDSKASIMIVDGLPKINPAAILPKICSCDTDKKGKCVCHTKLPCKCGAKVKAECICAQLETICICDENKPNVVCTCGAAKVCVCHEGLPQPVCICDKIDKPCVCYPDKFPYPVCTCGRKPKFGYLMDKDANEELDFEGEYAETEESKIEEGSEEEEEEEEEEEDEMGKRMSKKSRMLTDINEEEPCICQKPDPKIPCLCLKGKECTCKQDMCICGVQKSCVCEPVDSKESIICKSEDSKSICSCPVPRECTCGAGPGECKCFPVKKICTCGDPENCKCAVPCDCTNPCICDTKPKIEEECVCLDKAKQVEKGLVCTCPCKDGGRKLRKSRAGKHGYRWCREVDPRHTFFDYGYGRHDKILDKEQEKERFKILGLHDDKDEMGGTCPVHGIDVPPYKKKIRKPSLDCCSAVGGISISVETLGEDKDKFLVQVVSHSSKEGAKTGSKLVSILDCNLHTMEENRVEHITKKDITKERRSYMAICESGYYNKVTRLCGERDVVKRLYHSFEDARNFLLEGANVVLLRYFGLRQYKGTIKTETVLMDGTICQSIYACPGMSQAVVNGKPMYVVKIERHIIEPSGYIHQTLTVLSLRGYIISHEWADSNYVLHLNPLLNINSEKDEIEQHAPLRENWRNDLQLLSDYLDFKSLRSSEGARYVAENGVLTATVRDYLQAVLLLRPHDALHFTRHYYASALSALDLPHDEYFDPCPKHVRYFYFED